MDNNDIKVSVCCLVYNHEKYLRKCLDGFVMQKTNFAFEVLINDDKSTDSSAEIIKEYYEKYPDVFVPVFQTENQYSKGVKVIDDILIPMAKGKYIALCEGDDYWCDENKLQLQYNYMENDEECVMCLHNTVFHYLDGSHKDRLFNNWKINHILTEKETFIGSNVHTSSYFIRKEYAKKPSFGRSCWAGDFVIKTWLYTCGKLVVLPHPMSVYNAGVEGSATELNQKSVEIMKKNSNNLINYLEKLNVETHYKFNETIKNVIEKQYFSVLIFKFTKMLSDSNNKNEIIKTSKEITANDCYPVFMKKNKDNNSWLKYLMIKFKYEGYVIYPIWRLAYNLYYGTKNKGKHR